MATYTIYQCSVCRRTKDVLNDNTRAFLNYCIITKGCAGRLFPIGESPFMTATAPVAGITDWYPNGTVQTTREATVTAADISLSCSSANTVVLALLLTTTEKHALTALTGNQIAVTFEQRKTSDIAFSQFSYRTTIAQTTVSGKDRNGINMRFDQNAIDENRVFVLANGVARFVGAQPDEIVLTPNTVTFNTAPGVGAAVSVAVYQEKSAVPRTLNFQINSATAGIESSAWSNVRHFDNAEADVTDDNRRRWWLFSCSGSNLLSLSSGSTMRLVSIEGLADTEFATRARFVLAKSPFTVKDRYLNFYCDADFLHNDFAITVVAEGSSKYLKAAAGSATEIFPPFKLMFVAAPIGSSAGKSYISYDAEVVTVTSGAIIDDTAQTVLSQNTIIGPV